MPGPQIISPLQGKLGAVRPLATFYFGGFFFANLKYCNDINVPKEIGN
jgi:hypothetical protein